MGSFEHKFPRTPHLHGSGATRDDRVLSQRDTLALLSQPLLIEEKIDGSNVGISFDEDGALRLQNRGHFLSMGEHEQYGPLWPFVYERREVLFELLGPDRVLFGEWCFARHSCAYDALPAYLLVFDLYDKRDKSFADRATVDRVCAQADCATVPILGRGVVLRTLDALERMVGRSRFGPERAEGAYLRLESDGQVKTRCKWVRPDFTAGITEHWKRRSLEKNQLFRELSP
ncbi:MAG: RNA ligase family protein [Deltaproteobacteria bacterium]|nr:RNA ligase family protein [Deltaproteobacteria bacterium]